MQLLKQGVAWLGTLLFLYLAIISLTISKNVAGMFSWPLLLAGVLATLMVLIFLFYFFKRGNFQTYIFLILFFVISVALQVYMALHFIGNNVWDGKEIMMQGYAVAKGDGHWSSYFSSFPNNVNPVLILVLILKIFPMFSTVKISIVLNLIMFFLFDLMLFCVFTVLKKRTNINIAALVFILMTLFFPFYAMSLFFYPDALAVSFPPLAALFFEKFFDRSDKKIGLVYFGLGVIFILIGFEMKTNLAVYIIALIIAFALFLKKGWTKKEIKTLGSMLLIFVLITMGTVYLTKSAQNVAGYRNKTEYKIPWQHWTMMGLNSSSHGAVSSEDYAYTVKQHTLNEKKKADTKIILKRFNKMRLAGFLSQMQDKSILQWQNSAVSSYSVLNQYRDYSKGFNVLIGNKNTVWLNVNQVIYTSILFLAAFSCALQALRIGRDRSFFSWYWGVISIIGIFLFHALMWEAENRYAFIALPFLFIIGGSGINDLVSMIGRIKKNARSTQTNSWRFLCNGIAVLGMGLSSWGIADNWQLTKSIPMQNMSANQIQVNKIQVFTHNDMVKQKIKASKSFNTVKVQLPLDKHVEVKLLNAHNKTINFTSSILTDNSSDFNFQLQTQTQPAGTYSILIKNNGFNKLSLYHLSTGGYQMTPYVFGRSPFRSLAYSVFKETNGYNVRRSILVGIYLVLILVFSSFVVIIERYRFVDHRIC